MKHQRVLTSGLVISAIVNIGFLAGCGGGTASTGGGGNPVPTITAMSPTSAVAGSAAGFTLTINGANFMAGSMVTFGGTMPTTTFVSSTQLTAAIPAAVIGSAGTASVTVTNPTPGGGTSNMLNFAINSGTNPIPMISSLDPSCAPVGAQTFTLAVMGINFAASSVVRWNGKDLSTTLNGGPLVAQIPAGDIAATGTATVTVFNPAPGGGVSNSVTFNIVAGGVGPTSLAVDPTGKFAYVANEGCPDAFASNVSMYTIDASSGLLTSVGPPVTTGDFGADSVAVDPSGKFAYVANWGEGNTAGSVSMYTINPAGGALTLTGTIVAPCAPPPSPGSCAPWFLALHPLGKFAYVANEGGFTPTSVSMYTINATTGAVTLIGTIAADGRAVSVAIDPSGKFAYVADGGDNSDGSKGVNVSMYTIDAATGVLTSIGKIAAGMSPFSIAIHPNGKFVYVGNSGSNDLSIYTIDATSGKLTLTGTVAGILGIVIHPSGQFGYVSTSIYTIDTTTGALTFAGTTGAGSSPGPSTIHPSGKFAYGMDHNSNTVFMYSIDAATGSLTLIGTIGT
ncbi:MAG TPA: beta-propeller fold lactonase family protein [Candidatus Sulfotelmatobacter sp.]|nr:beta-propeller fold lactonase family protein [Candidatus Sulfotelmatobacter sp.]